MKKQSTLFITTFLLSFTSFFTTPSFSQTIKAIDLFGATSEINGEKPAILNATKSSSSPLYYYPDYPSFDQVQADGACQSVGGSSTESATVSFTIPDKECTKLSVFI